MAEESDRSGVVVVGSINMDLVIRAPHVPQPGETVLGRGFATIPGGKGANQAMAVARLGEPCKLIGRVGDDDFGERLLMNLQGNRVDVEHVFHQYTVRVTGDLRNRLAAHLAEAGISTAIYYPQGLHELAFLGGPRGSLPVCESACSEVLSLPIWPELAQDSERLARITRAVTSFFAAHTRPV